jgi:hypothetical protein
MGQRRGAAVRGSRLTHRLCALTLADADGLYANPLMLAEAVTAIVARRLAEELAPVSARRA